MKVPLFLLAICALSFSTQTTKLVPLAELMGKFDPATHADFIRVDDAYASKPGIYIRKEAYDSFKRMFYAAKKCGVDLEIISGTRSFAHQRSIWERKWRLEKYAGWNNADKARDILLFSSMPGTSRHHWGTDIDLNALNNEYFAEGKGKDVYHWLKTHASEYGFHQPYTSKQNGRTGYEEEKWHWTYLPLSQSYLKQVNEEMSYSSIKGFSGSELAGELRMIEDFVNGVELPQ